MSQLPLVRAVLVGSWLTLNAVSFGPPPSAHYRIRGPIYVNSNQLAMIESGCANLQDISKDRIVLEILGDTPDGLVVWWLPGGEIEMQTLPIWLSPTGGYWTPKHLKSGYTLNDIIWKRKIPAYETIWLTDQQIAAIKVKATEFGRNTKHRIGVLLLRRTNQGFLLKLKSEGNKVMSGQIICITDLGQVELPDLTQPITKLMWRDTRKRDDAMAKKHARGSR